MSSSIEINPPPPPRLSAGRARWIALGVAALILGAIGVVILRGRPGPPPPAIAHDPILVRGYEIYSTRCASCHGPTGWGDGPLAKGLAGPAMRNLGEDPWKYGDTPERVVAVLTNGIKDSAMPGWGGVYGRADLNATAAYLYHLTDRSVPAAFRVP